MDNCSENSEILCPICCDRFPLKLKYPNSFITWKCRNCSLIWVPNVKDEVIEKFYSNNYFKNPDGDLGYLNYVEDEYSLRMNFRLILSKLPPPGENNKLLDIGCAYGFFLDEARKMGWDTTGIEIYEEGINYSAKILHLNVIQETIMQADFPDQSFDCVVIIGSIEHFQDPIAVIKKVSRILKPGGGLIITTINTKGLIRLFSIKPPEHLYYFSAYNLSLLLRLNNFEFIKCAPYWCYYQLNEALCRAYRLIFKSSKRIEQFLEKIPFLNVHLRVPTNEMLVISWKKKH